MWVGTRTKSVLFLLSLFFFRAHWFLVVVCFPALEDVQYESFPSPAGELRRAAPSRYRADVEGDASDWLMF